MNDLIINTKAPRKVGLTLRQNKTNQLLTHNKVIKEETPPTKKLSAQRVGHMQTMDIHVLNYSQFWFTPNAPKKHNRGASYTVLPPCFLLFVVQLCKGRIINRFEHHPRDPKRGNDT